MNAHYKFDQFQHQQPPPSYLQGAYASELSGSPHVPYSPNTDYQQPLHSARESQHRSLHGVSHHHSSQSEMHQQSQHFSYTSDHIATADDLRRQEIYARLAAERKARQQQESVHGGNSQQTAAFGMQQTMDNQEQTARKEMVQRMLNERKMNRSGQVSQYSHQEESNNLGGYNPEALYQEEMIEQYSQQESSNERQSQQQQMSIGMRQSYPDQQSSNAQQYIEDEDTKYRDAVAYARAEIERERKQRLQQMYQEQQNSRRGAAAQVLDQSSARHSRSGEGSHQRSVESAQGNNTHNGSTSGQKLSQLERYLQHNSQEKIHLQMNNNQRTHNFTYDSESETKPVSSRVQKLSRNKKASADEKGFRSTGPPTQTGEYMKPTVNADLKRDKVQIAKTKHLVSETEKKFKEQHTFKPQIKEYPLPPSKEVSKEERWKKLTEPKTALMQQRERIRAQIEIEETQRNCPFKPQLNQTINTGYISNRSGNTTAGYSSLDVADRLLHEADLRKEKREKLKRELELQQMKDCSFKPKILSATTSSKSQSTLAVVNLEKFQIREPIHQRVGELQKEKNEKLQKLRIEAEKEQQESFTFQPSVNKKSAKIAIVKQATENGNSVVDRLYRDANDRIEKQMSNNVSMNEQMNREYSFHPQISKTSAYLSAQNDNFSGNMKDFHARQEEFIRRQHEKRAEAKKKWGDEERYSYKPEINATSEVIVESDPLRGQENDSDKLERLYKRDQKKQEVVRELVEREVYGQYTFKPEINRVSKAIARNSASIDELAYNPKGKERKEQLQEQMMTQEFSDCTFRPQTTKTKKYQNVTSMYSMQDCSTTEEYSKKLKDKLKQKQERIAQERREREYQMLKDCTFKPQIIGNDHSTIVSSNNNESVASVKGIQRHLELKELKKKQEEEKRLREAEVFGLNHKFAVRSDDLDLSRLPPSKIPQSQYVQHQTIPEPFELTKGAEHRKQQLTREVKEREMQECTFKPKTNEGRNKQIIQQLMRQENLVTNENPLDSRASLNNYAKRNESNDDKENYYNYPQQMTNGNYY